MKPLILGVLMGVAALGAGPAGARDAQTCAGENEAACMLGAIWVAAAVLPKEKQVRLARPFLETVSLSSDAHLIQEWRTRLGASVARRSSGIPYARQKAELALSAGDWDEFLRDARAGVRPFNIGRPEIMAEGARMAPNAAIRRRVMEAMFDLAGPRQQASGLDRSFEQADFGYALAELSMQTCDLGQFDRAVALTADPDSLRYALWRRRMTGNAAALAGRIRQDANADDTHHVRTALEGYAPILENGYCP
tara:strand:- start:1863 stop:2615 length:753 start_codon:yes stop_codon:yes gene_type:complete